MKQAYSSNFSLLPCMDHDKLGNSYILYIPNWTVLQRCYLSLESGHKHCLSSCKIKRMLRYHVTNLQDFGLVRQMNWTEKMDERDKQ